MEFITITYLFFVLVSLYFSSLFLLLFYKNKEDLYNFKISNKLPSLTVLIPAYNEEKSIKETIEFVKDVNYPKELMEIIVINDGSKDKTLEIIKNIKNIKILNKENTGKADSINNALKIARGEVIVINDADSFPEKDAFIKMAPYFNDFEIGAVTSSIFVKNKNNLLEKLQNIEYMIIAYGRKLLEYIDGVFVTPGALSMYKKEALLKIGGFDKNNLTEDIEVAWNLLSKSYQIKMCFAARTYTIVPSKFKTWWKQRLRWDIGGLQTLYKYRHTILRSKYKNLGLFVTPFFGSYIILSFVGFFISLFIFSRKLMIKYFSIYNSILSNTSVFRLDTLNLSPNVFTFFGILLFLTFLIYVIIGIKTIDNEKINLNYKFNILVYLLFYLTLGPLVLIHSIYRISIGKFQW